MEIDIEQDGWTCKAAPLTADDALAYVVGYVIQDPMGEVANKGIVTAFPTYDDRAGTIVVRLGIIGNSDYVERNDGRRFTIRGRRDQFDVVHYTHSLIHRIFKVERWESKCRAERVATEADEAGQATLFDEPTTDAPGPVTGAGEDAENGTH